MSLIKLKGFASSPAMVSPAARRKPARKKQAIQQVQIREAETPYILERLSTEDPLLTIGTSPPLVFSLFIRIFCTCQVHKLRNE
jgi:hypothetical protein